MNMFRLSSICAATLLATAAIAAPAPAITDSTSGDALTQGTILAREAEKGDDHRGRGRGGDPRLTDEAGTLVAREAETGDDHRGRGRGGDPRLGEEAASSVA